MPLQHTIPKAGKDKRYNNLILSPLSPSLPSDQYTALERRQALESVYEQRNSDCSRHQSCFLVTSFLLERTTSSTNTNSNSGGLQDMTVNSEQRLKRSKVRYSTRKALKANWEPDFGDSYLNYSHFYDYGDTDQDNSSISSVGREALVTYHNDEHNPPWYLNNPNELWRYGNANSNVGQYPAEKKLNATPDETQQSAEYANQRNSYSTPVTSHYVDELDSSRETQIDASVTTVPPLHSRFSWSDSGSEDLEELIQTPKRRSFFGDKQQESRDSDCNTTRISSPRKSFIDSVRRSFGRR